MSQMGRPCSGRLSNCPGATRLVGDRSRVQTHICLKFKFFTTKQSPIPALREQPPPIQSICENKKRGGALAHPPKWSREVSRQWLSPCHSRVGPWNLHFNKLGGGWGGRSGSTSSL